MEVKNLNEPLLKEESSLAKQEKQRDQPSERVFSSRPKRKRGKKEKVEEEKEVEEGEEEEEEEEEEGGGGGEEGEEQEEEEKVKEEETKEEEEEVHTVRAISNEEQAETKEEESLLQPLLAKQNEPSESEGQPLLPAATSSPASTSDIPHAHGKSVNIIEHQESENERLKAAKNKGIEEEEKEGAQSSGTLLVYLAGQEGVAASSSKQQGGDASPSEILLGDEGNAGFIEHLGGDASSSLTTLGHEYGGVTGMSVQTEGVRGVGGASPNIQPDEGGVGVQDNTRPCIFELDANSKKLHDVFTPKKFSVGPIHQNSKLTYTESAKERYVYDFTARVGENTVAEFNGFLRENEGKIRNSYASDLSNVESEELITIISRDASFFIEIMLKSTDPDQVAQVDFLRNPELKLKVVVDFLLLENQIPFFVHLRLWRMYQATRSETDILQFFRIFAEFFEIREGVPKGLKWEAASQVCHLLDLRRMMEIGWIRENRITTQHVRAASATTLTKYGVQFRPNQRTACIFKFSKSIFCLPVLNIPQLFIEGGWESRVANMMAFEGYYYKNGEARMICQLIYLVRCLIQKFEDMELLMEQKVIIVEAPELESAYEGLKKVSKGLKMPYVRPAICEDTDKVVNKCNLCKVELGRIFCNSIKKISEGILQIWPGDPGNCCQSLQNCVGGCLPGCGIPKN